MNAYLDTSVLISMLTVDDNSPQAAAWLSRASRRLALSDWTLTEFSSGIALSVRAGRLTEADRAAAEAALQVWLVPDRPVEAVGPDDIRMARTFIQTTRLPLRAGDALHIAIAQRLGDALATFDHGMARAAADFGLTVEAI